MLYRIVFGLQPESARSGRPSNKRKALARQRLATLGFHPTRTGRFTVTGFLDETRLGVIGMPPGSLRLGMHHHALEDPVLRNIVNCFEVIPAGREG